MKSKDLSDERRSQILDAAETVFARRGFDKARMDDIVSESGLSKGALYWYYKSKDALIQALLDRVFLGELKEVEGLVTVSKPASTRLKTFIGLAVQEYRRLERLLPLAYEFVSLAARSKAVRSRITGYFRRYIQFISEIIQQGIDSGEFKPCDPEATAISLTCMYEGMAMLWFIDPSLIDWDEMAEAPFNTFLQGLLRESG